MYHSFIRVDQGYHVLKFTYLGVVEQYLYETMVHDIDDLQKYLMQTWFDFEQDIIDAAIDQWRDRLRSLLCAC